jgi:Zn-dependent alcohol dehydrogenase
MYFVKMTIKQQDLISVVTVKIILSDRRKITVLTSCFTVRALLSFSVLSCYVMFCFILCSTGLGAVWKTCNVTEGSTVAVFGLGAVGLACIQVGVERNCTREKWVFRLVLV